VDVNGDGVRDAMPSLDSAWRSMGLVGRGRTVTPSVFRGCVARDVTTLVRDRLLTPAAAAGYEREATAYPNLTW
jgi:hypothetical protein